MMTELGLDSVVDGLRSGRLASLTRFDEPLGPLTTYGVGGRATALVTLEIEADVEALITVLHGAGVPIVVLGRGSNLLVADTGFSGVAVALGVGFAGVTIDGTNVEVGAAAKLPIVARTTVQAGLAGFEWAVGVPGSIGGALRMNAGGHGAEMVDSLLEADVVDLVAGRRSWRSAESLALAYRRSALGATDLVIAARFRLQTGDPAEGKAKMVEIVQWRRANQPGGQNAGSVFTNPEGDSAGRLIEAAGVKGLRIGTAEVSTKHANFIQADADGTAADVRAVMREVIRRVASTQGVELRPETHMIGFVEEDDQ